MELQTPTAIVTVGGLLSATALTMLVLPVLRWRFGPSAVPLSLPEEDAPGAPAPADTPAPEPA